MTAIDMYADSGSPFDALRQVRDDGTEFWSARDLMQAVRYDQWRNFESAVERAWAVAENQGQDPAHHFADASKVIESGRWGRQAVADVHLTRFGAYLVVMNGDPRKPEIAAAQAYFAVKTREAETNAAVRPDITSPEGVLALAEQFTDTARRLVEAHRQIEADSPKVRFANAVADSDDLILVRDLAKILHANGATDLGGTRLFGRMREDGYLIKSGSDYNMPTQRSMELGLFRVIEREFGDADKGIKLRRTPKVTAKGQQYFVNRYCPESAVAR